MPTKTVFPTAATKLGVCATTYRGAPQNIFGTCPKSCELLPKPDRGSNEIDQSYLSAVLDAVPRAGWSWAYSHFPHDQLPRPQPNKTLINASCDTIEAALSAAKSGRASVYAAPEGDTDYPRTVDGVRFVACPACVHPNKVTCTGSATTHACGGNKGPLCARPRDYVIVFFAHGSAKKQVGQPTQGGCYAACGRTMRVWNYTSASIGKNIIADDDPQRLVHWAKSLPPGTKLRHMIAGDFGLPK